MLTPDETPDENTAAAPFVVVGIEGGGGRGRRVSSAVAVSEGFAGNNNASTDSSVSFDSSSGISIDADGREVAPEIATFVEICADLESPGNADVKSLGSVDGAPESAVAEAPLSVVAEAPVSVVAEAPVSVVAEAPESAVAAAPEGTVTEAQKGVVVEAPESAVAAAPEVAVEECRR